MCSCTQFMLSRSLNPEPCVCLASTLPTEPHASCILSFINKKNHNRRQWRSWIVLTHLLKTKHKTHVFTATTSSRTYIPSRFDHVRFSRMFRVFTVLEELPEYVSALTTNSMCNSELLAEQELEFRLGEFISVQLIRDKRSQCCLFQEFFLDISDL